MQRILAAVQAHWRSMLATTGETERKLLLSRRLTAVFGAFAYVVIIMNIALNGLTPASRAALIVVPPLLFTFYITTRYLPFVAALITTNIGIGAAVVLFSAAARPPHVEIVYLLLIPLLSSVYLSSRLTGLMGMVAITILIGFVLWMRPTMPMHVGTDLIGFFGLCTVILVAIGWQRARYESERQRMALEAQRVELMQSVLRSISHDFRTPLTVIETSLYLLEKDRTDASRAKRVERIREQATRLNVMVDEILDAARDGAETTLPHSPVDFSELTVSCVNGLRLVAARRTIELVAEVPEAPVMLSCHRPSIERMLVNLIENAINYNANEGTVTVSAVMRVDTMILSVRDTGIGISPEHLPHIFEPFYRADVARSTRTGGAGLGLTSVKRIVDEHGGTIDVESTTGEGTTFIVTLPLSLEAEKSMA